MKPKRGYYKSLRLERGNHITYQAFIMRMSIGWTVEEALTTPHLGKGGDCRRRSYNK